MLATLLVPIPPFRGVKDAREDVMKRFFVLGLAFCLTGLAADQQKVSTVGLTRSEAETLIRNMPEFVRAKSEGRCPEYFVADLGENALQFQLRNMCTASASGMMGNYVIDLRTGEIWEGIDKERRVDSPRLRRLRQQFLRRLTKPTPEARAGKK